MAFWHLEYAKIYDRTTRCLAKATATLPTPVASAHEPTKISTVPYPNRPNRAPVDDEPPASSSNPEMMGPMMAETPFANAIPANAMLANSAPAHSTAAFVQVDEKPPAYQCAM